MGVKFCTAMKRLLNKIERRNKKEEKKSHRKQQKTFLTILRYSFSLFNTDSRNMSEAKKNIIIECLFSRKNSLSIRT